MTRDDIIRLAREVGGVEKATVWLFDEIELERFAALVAAVERVSCATMLRGEALKTLDPLEANAVRWCANAILARGEQK